MSLMVHILLRGGLIGNETSITSMQDPDFPCISTTNATYFIKIKICVETAITSSAISQHCAINRDRHSCFRRVHKHKMPKRYVSHQQYQL